MIFFSHKIKFKKQSQSLGLNLNDKHIKRSKGQLIELSKKFKQVDEELKKKKTQFQIEKNNLISQHNFLLQQQKRHKLKIIKLEVRKDQLNAKQNPLIRQEKAKQLKKYLKCMAYTIGDKYQLIRSMGRCSTFQFIKSKVLNLQLRIYTKIKMNDIVFMKKLNFQDQKIMLMIKQFTSLSQPHQYNSINISSQNSQQKNNIKTLKSLKNSSKSRFNNISDQRTTNNQQRKSYYYEIKIFSLTGKSYQITKIYTQQQLEKWVDRLTPKSSKQTDNNSNNNGKLFKNSHNNSNNKQPLLANNTRRLSLQFNSVFKKSLQGFFYKRTSHTSNQLQNKLVNIQQLVKSKHRDSKYINSSSDRSKNSHDSRNNNINGNKTIRQQLGSKQENTERQQSDFKSMGSSSSEDNSQRISNSNNQKSVSNDSGKYKQLQQHLTNKKIKKQKDESKDKDNQDSFNTKTKKTKLRIKNSFQQQQQQNSKDSPIQSKGVINQNESKQIDQQGQQQQKNNQSQISNTTKYKGTSIKTQITTGFIRSFFNGQAVLFPNNNPLLNMVILKNKNQFYFISEYLSVKQNFDRINLCVKKYQLKIKLQKQRRKCLLHRKITFQNFFQTENRTMQPFSLSLLFSVKYAKDDIYIPKREQIKQQLRQGKQLKSNAFIKGSKSTKLSFQDIKSFSKQDIVISCQNIKCQSEDKTFLIHTILREEMLSEMSNRVFDMMNINTITNRAKGREKGGAGQTKKKNQIQSKSKRQLDIRKKRRKKISKDDQQSIIQLKSQQQLKQQQFRKQIKGLFQKFIQQHYLSIQSYRFLKKINFSLHLQKIILLQKHIRGHYYKNLYKIKKQLNPNKIIYKFQPNSKILISTIQSKQNNILRVFIQCLMLRENNKYKSYPLVYESKYWGTIVSSLNSLYKLSESVVEVRDQVERFLNKRTYIYQKEQARLEALKPELYLNRLRRFFINIMLRVKAKNNIMYLKKIYHNSEIYVLIVRKSPILKSLCHVNLYRLQDFAQRNDEKQNLVQQNLHYDDQHDAQLPFQATKTTKTIAVGNKLQNKNNSNCEKRMKVHYQTINLLVEYFAKIPKQRIADEFFFNKQHFLLKPSKSPTVFYIQRLLSIDINSQQITKQITMIEWQEPMNKIKREQNQGQNLENLSSLNGLNIMKQSFQKNFTMGESSCNRNCYQNSKQKSNQKKYMRQKRKNDSIYIPVESSSGNKQKNINGVLNTIQNRLSAKKGQRKQRKSFRVSIRNNCIIESKNKYKKDLLLNSQTSNNGKMGMINMDRIYEEEEQSNKKLSSGQRLSRSSLFDVFNNNSSHSGHKGNKKLIYELKGNGHGKMLYYSLLKVQQIFYELHVYIVNRRYAHNKENRFQGETDKNKNGNSTRYPQNQIMPDNKNEATPMALAQKSSQTKPSTLNLNFKKQSQDQSLVWNDQQLQEQQECINRRLFNDQLFLIHKQNISKKQLLQANWTFIYNRLAVWIKNNQSQLVLVQEQNAKK